ncbi:hypothetical protein FAES_4021 [Fibrella aestuarina BUZ 2]|uniref:Uncharacterized protein n=1 Tax=Fibrella aestuarina BUZ 2 TaxID=1166018 RepID=I0KD18_9BACT|nr:hypothetical protein [Fibrella aestuarina]CCH02021.1 hypothetical protein FAES_4021 [Fibrella aestuarina BUZ 2]
MIHSVDHPLIIFGQAVGAVALVRLYFILRTAPFPLPQLTLGAAVAMVTNLVARSTNADWFYITDIAQYWSLSAVFIASIYKVLHRQKTTPAETTEPDFFDRYSMRITWGVGMAIAALLLYNYVKAYADQRVRQQQITQAAVEASTRARQQYAAEVRRRDQHDQSFRDSLLRQVDSMAQVGQTLLQNQGQILKTQQRVEAKTQQNTVLTRRALQTAKPVPTPEKVQPVPSHEKPKDSRSIWQKIFGKRAAADSAHVYLLRADPGFQSGAEAADLTVLH